MVNRLKIKIKEIITSIKGMAVYIFMFAFLLVMLFVLALAIDISAYLAVKTHLQNALDISSTTALNRSTLDQYRSDKILKIIFDMNSHNAYTKKLEESIKANLNIDNSQNIIINDNLLIFKPDIALSPYEAKLTIQTTQSGGEEYDEDDPTDSHNVADISNRETKQEYRADYDIELEISTFVDLPVYKKVTDLLSLGLDKDIFKVPINVKTYIRGVRIKAPEDFKVYDFQELNPNP